MQKKNPYSEDYTQSTEHLRLAIAYLAKYEIPLSPLNYRLGYECISGQNEELKDALEALISQPDSLSDDSLWKLYQQFFMADEAVLETIRNELSRVIASFQDEFKSAGGKTSSYIQNLSNFVKVLDTSAPPEAISSAVKKVIEETHLVEQSQLQIETQISGILAEVSTLEKKLEQAKQDSLIDALTGIPNRRAFDAALEQSIHITDKESAPLCILMVDIDHFKEFNDTYGHLVGDNVLQLVAATLKQCVKGKDIVSRFGGEEFTIILPHTDLDNACIVAEQIRKTIATSRLTKKSSGEYLNQIQISIGVTQFNKSDNSDGLIERADRALYQAKSNGRNRIEKIV